MACVNKILVAAVLVSGFMVVMGQPDASQYTGDKDMLPCEKYSRSFEMIVTKVMTRFKNFFNKKIMFSDDHEEAEALMEKISEVVEGMKTDINKAVRKVKSEIKDKQEDSEPDPCSQFMKVNVTEVKDPDTGGFVMTNFMLENAPKTCQPGKTWIALKFDGDQSSETDIIKRLIPHHRRVAACNNSDIVDIKEDILSSSSGVMESRYNITLGGQCAFKLKTSMKKLLVRKKTCESDGSFMIYQIDGLDQQCPRRPGCGLPRFKKVRDTFDDIMEDDDEEEDPDPITE